LTKLSKQLSEHLVAAEHSDIYLEHPNLKDLKLFFRTSKVSKYHILININGD